MKKTLDAIEKQSNMNLETDRNDECIRLSTRQIATSARRMYEVQCIFCEKKHKFLKGQKTRESLVQCRELRADKTISIAALKKSDTPILAVVSRDLVAAEAHYHRSCYCWSRLVASMHLFDITEVLVSTKKHIRRKLENEFAGSLHILPDEKGKLLVLPDNLSLYDLARHNQRLQAELDTFSNMPENVVSKAVMQLRSDVVSNEYE